MKTPMTGFKNGQCPICDSVDLKELKHTEIPFTPLIIIYKCNECQEKFMEIHRVEYIGSVTID